jgi:hypothetical protein
MIFGEQAAPAAAGAPVTEIAGERLTRSKVEASVELDRDAEVGRQLASHDQLIASVVAARSIAAVAWPARSSATRCEKLTPAAHGSSSYSPTRATGRSVSTATSASATPVCCTASSDKQQPQRPCAAAGQAAESEREQARARTSARRLVWAIAGARFCGSAADQRDRDAAIALARSADRTPESSCAPAPVYPFERSRSRCPWRQVSRRKGGRPLGVWPD